MQDPSSYLDGNFQVVKGIGGYRSTGCRYKQTRRENWSPKPSEACT